MGVNKLNSLMKRVTERASLDNSHLINLSTRNSALFKGAVFYRGNFTININSSSSSTEGHKQQSYERIKCIFDSSDNKDSPSLT